LMVSFGPWQYVRYILQFMKPIYNMIQFSYTDQSVIGEVYEKMDNILGEIKDIVEPRDAILYDHIHKHVIKRWDNVNVPLHALEYALTSYTKILFSILVGPTNTWRWG